MTETPINLDDRRSAIEQLETDMRRRLANNQPPVRISKREPHLESLEDQMLVEPARTWIEVMEKWRFLLDRYAATPEAEDERTQMLIKRAISDMERLINREERT